MNPAFTLGLLAAGLCLGWLVGGSSTPVAGAAIPVVFGAVAAVFTALAGAGQITSEDSKKGTSTPWPRRRLALLRINHKAIAGIFGFTLLWFFSGFGGGLYLGARARIEGWFQPAPISELPWSREAPPPDLATAVEWVALAERLTERGYSAAQITDILRLANKSNSTGAATLSPGTPAQTIASVQEAVQRLAFANYLREIGCTPDVIATALNLPWSKERFEVSIGTRTESDPLQSPKLPPLVRQPPVLQPWTPKGPVLRVDPIGADWSYRDSPLPSRNQIDLERFKDISQ